MHDHKLYNMPKFTYIHICLLFMLKMNENMELITVNNSLLILCNADGEYIRLNEIIGENDYEKWTDLSESGYRFAQHNNIHIGKAF